MIEELIKKNRSYRRFYEEEEMDLNLLKSLVNLARFSASARNMQSIRYKIINDANTKLQLFPLLKWAGYLEHWDGPIEGERPSAYILLLNDEIVSNNYYCDDGLMTQNITLGAVKKGFGACIIAAIDRPRLRALLNIDDKYKIIHIIALGKPKEEIVLEDIDETESIKYWRDSKAVHHVPKRKLDDLII